MLHIITYDLKDATLYEPLCAKLNEMGDAYPCTQSTFFLHTSRSAGGVDSEIRQLVDGKANFAVIDITGIGEDRYFGRIPAREEGDRLWNWLKTNNA